MKKTFYYKCIVSLLPIFFLQLILEAKLLYDISLYTYSIGLKSHLSLDALTNISRLVHRDVSVKGANVRCDFNQPLNYIFQEVKLHYVTSGNEDKPLMLFLHGFPDFWYAWRHQIVEFSQNYRYFYFIFSNFSHFTFDDNI